MTGERPARERYAGRPSGRCGQTAWIDGVEITAGRQYVRHAATRRSGRSGRHVGAIERRQKMARFIGGSRQVRRQCLAHESQGPRQQICRHGDAQPRRARLIRWRKPSLDQAVDAGRQERALRQIPQKRPRQLIDGGSDLPHCDNAAHPVRQDRRQWVRPHPQAVAQGCRIDSAGASYRVDQGRDIAVRAAQDCKQQIH